MVYGTTAHKVCICFGRSSALGLQKTAVGLRPLCVFSPPHFGPPQTCGLLYGRAKTSYTAGTLGEIIFELVGKYIDKKCKIE
jgi:hypothetical protein